MLYRVGDFKNGWTLYRELRKTATRVTIVYELCKDALSIDDVLDMTTGERPAEQPTKGGRLYSMLITVHLEEVTSTSIPVRFETGELFTHLREGFKQHLRQDPEPPLPGTSNIVIPFKTYEELIKTYVTLEHYTAWKMYEAAKIRYDRTGQKDFSANGELLLFPSERDIRKRIHEEEQKRKEQQRKS